MAKIIINADDFGLSESVNTAIIEAFKKGYITNTTLMVNMPGTEDAVKRAKELGLWDRVGLHLNLYEGVPLNNKLKSFDEVLGEDKQLTYWTHGLLRFYLGRRLLKEVKNEIELQITRFLDFDPICMHVDSHGHSHTNYSVWRLCKPLFVNHGFISTRLARNLYVSCGVDIREGYKNLYNSDVRRSFQFNTDYFGGFSDFKSMMETDSKNFETDCIVELMCHPIYEEGKLVNKGNLDFFEVLEFVELFNKDKF